MDKIGGQNMKLQISYRNKAILGNDLVDISWSVIIFTADGCIWERLCEDMYLEGTGNLANKTQKAK